MLKVRMIFLYNPSQASPIAIKLLLFYSHKAGYSGQRKNSISHYS